MNTIGNLVVIFAICGMCLLVFADGQEVQVNSPDSNFSGLKQEWTGLGFENVPVTGTYITMKFTPDEISEWYHTRYQTNPAASEGLLQGEGSNGSKSLLRYLSYIPKEWDQAYCGNCWIWGTTGAMEVALSAQANVTDRLSIQYMNSNYHNGGKYPFSKSEFACDGGWPEYVADFYMYSGEFGGKRILVPWNNSNASYADVKGSEIGHTIVDPANIQTNPHYPVTSFTVQTVKTTNVSWKQAKENIKCQIDNNKAVIFAFMLPDSAAWDSFRRFWGYGDEKDDYFRMDQYTSRSYDETNGGGGHAVVLTGYQDYGDHGYWECLNSWGTTNSRPNGLFYIDMNMDYSAKYANEIQAMYFETVDLTGGQPSPDPSSMTLTLLPGWNLVSTPKTLKKENDTFAIFGGVDSAGHSLYTCDPVSGWKKAQPTDTFSPLTGIWIYANTTSTIQLQFDTDPIRSPPVRSLFQGWSTIGSSATTPISVHATLASVDSLWNYLIPFDSKAQRYGETIIKGESGAHSPSYLMQPGSGYWIYMAGNGTLSAVSN